MTLILSGSDGLSDVDGSAATPAIRGTDANTGIFFPAADTIAFAEGGVESMRLDSSGSLIVNGTSASSILTIYPASGSSNTLTYRTSGNTGAGALYAYSDVNGPAGGIGHNLSINSAGASARFNTTYAAWSIWMDVRTGIEAMRFDYLDTSGTYSERMRITPAGDLLIGSAVTPSGSVGGAGFIREGNLRSTLFMASNTTSGTTLAVMRNPNGDVGTIQTSGSSTTYATSSDYRLKENVAPMTGALARVSALKPVTYKWKVDGSDGEGFIAHELQAVVPNCVTGEKDAVGEQQYEITPAVKDEEGRVVTAAVMGTRIAPVYQGIDTSFLVATLTAAIQEQQALIAALTNRITALEAK